MPISVLLTDQNSIDTVEDKVFHSITHSQIQNCVQCFGHHDLLLNIT